MSSSKDFNMSTNNEFFWQMFMQFLQTQASVTASQAPSIKSKCTQDSEAFTGEESFIEQIHECLETFGISLSLKMTLNLNRMTTSEARIAYTFSRTSGTAQEYIALQHLKNVFSDSDLEFYTQRKLMKLC